MSYKKILVIICLVTISVLLVSKDRLKSNTQVSCAEVLKPHYSYIVNLLEKNNIKIDYSKIKNITIAPMKDFRGYHAEGGVIIISYFGFNNKGTINEEVILTLAHEIAHSQGLKHTPNKIGLMFPSDKFDRYFIENKKIDSIIIDTFKIFKSSP